MNIFANFSRTKTSILSLSVLALACTLSACGGGSSGSTSPNNPPSDPGQASYTVTPSMNTGGAAGGNVISPSGSVSVQSGARTTFTLTPASGYAVSGVGGTCGGTLSGNTYTTNAVTANCTVTVTFAQVITGLSIAPCFTVDGPVEFNVAPVGPLPLVRSTVETSVFNNKDRITAQTVFYSNGSSYSTYWQVANDGIHILDGVSPADVANPVLILPLRMEPDQFVDYTTEDEDLSRFTFIGIGAFDAGDKRFADACQFRLDGLRVNGQGANELDPFATPLYSALAPGIGFIADEQRTGDLLGWRYSSGL